MESLKEQTIRLFLKFVECYVPLMSAQMATLGGQGLEADIWSELGIPHENGWLIERNRQRGSKLITQHRYRTQNQLGTFAQIFAGYGNERATIDAFHLDLCGTFTNKSLATFAPALPLVLRSEGQCLAITVSDARRNLVLEQWPHFWRRGKKLFGEKAERVYSELLGKQKCIPVSSDGPSFFKPFDPEKATRREFGLLVELTELLMSGSLPWTPVAVRRYVYVSRYQKRAFRMRTYFFHFGKRDSASPQMQFAKAWAGSDLFFGRGENFQEVKMPGQTSAPKSTKTAKGEHLMAVGQVSRLAALAKALGGAEEAEYDQLTADKQQLHAILQVLETVKGPRSATASREAEEEPIERQTEAQTGKGKGRTAAAEQRKTKRDWDDLTHREQIEWLLKALELRAESNGKWENGDWRQLLKIDFGHYSEALGKSLRAALARTSGKFREQFRKRIAKVFGDQAKVQLDRLGSL